MFINLGRLWVISLRIFNFIKKPEILSYQQKLQSHYKKMGVKVLPKDEFVKSCAEGLKVKKSKLLNPQFTIEGRKATFASNGIPFLMPNEILTPKKIDLFFKEFHKDVLDLYKNKCLNKESLQNVVDKYIPNKVKIKDFSDYAKDFESKDSKEQIDWFLQANAIHSSNCFDSSIYLNFDKMKSKDFKKHIKLLDEIEHEYRHAIRMHKTNDLKLKQYLNSEATELNFFGTQFCLYTRPKDSYIQVNDIGTKSYLKWYGQKYLSNNIKSLKDVYSSFKNDFASLSQDKKFKLPEDFQGKKDALKHMKLNAQDESQAYKSKAVLRECFQDKSKPTAFEFISMHHEQLAKFFHNNIVETCFEELLKKKAAKKLSKMQ